MVNHVHAAVSAKAITSRPTSSFSLLPFGDFTGVCLQSCLNICPSLDLPEPKCYSRNVDIAGFLLFQPAVLLIDIISIFMTLIMIYNVKRKYIAVGRKEMLVFFYCYMCTVILDMLLVTNIIGTSTFLYPYLAALYVGFVCASFWSLLLNGFVGFQWAEDGTNVSVWSIRLSSVGVLAASFLIAFGTFTDNFGLSQSFTIPLYIVFFLFNLFCFAVYVIIQIVLVLKTMDDRWPIGMVWFDSRRHFLWRAFFCSCASDHSLSLSNHLQAVGPLHGRAVLCKHADTAFGDDGVQVLGLHHEGRSRVFPGCTKRVFIQERRR